MIPELSIIRLFQSYTGWQKYRHLLKVEDFPRELQGIVRVLDAHHDAYGEGQEGLSASDLANLFFTTNPKDREYYQTLFENLNNHEPANEETTVGLIKSIVKSKILRDVALSAYEASEGRQDSTKVVEALRAIEALETASGKDDSEEDLVFVSTDLETLVEQRKSAPGLHWRLKALNQMFGPLRKGDFGFLFARPETGKTTILASEVSFMAEQTDGDILWLNNEEQGDKVMMRLYQASLGIDHVQLYRNVRENREQFLKRTGNRIKMVDRASIDRVFVERLCKRLNPRLIIIDQIDKLKGFDNDREDLRLGSIYIWARELAKKYCPVIAVCQADGSGEGVRWLTMANVANAKTAKQAEADWILGVGKVNDVGFEDIRYLHASKNKLDGDEGSNPELRHGRIEVLIQPEIARYKDLE